MNNSSNISGSSSAPNSLEPANNSNHSQIEDVTFGFELTFDNYTQGSSSFNYSMTPKAEHNSNELSPIPKALETITLSNNNNAAINEVPHSTSTADELAQEAVRQGRIIQDLINQPFEVTLEIIRLIPDPIYNPSDLQGEDIATLDQDLQTIFNNLRVLCQNYRHLTPNDLTAIEHLLVTYIQQHRVDIANLVDIDHPERRALRNVELINLIPLIVKEAKNRDLVGSAEAAAPIIQALSDFKQTLLARAYDRLPDHGDFANICEQTIQNQNNFATYIDTNNLFLNVLKPLYQNFSDPFMNLCNEIVGNIKDEIFAPILEPVNPDQYAQWEPPRLLPDHCSLEQGLDFIKMTGMLRETPGSRIEVDLATQLGLDNTLAKLTYNPRAPIPLSNQQLEDIETQFIREFPGALFTGFQYRTAGKKEMLLDIMISLVTSRLGNQIPANPTLLRRLLGNICFEGRNLDRLNNQSVRFLLKEYFARADARQHPQVMAKRALPQWKRDLYEAGNNK